MHPSEFIVDLEMILLSKLSLISQTYSFVDTYRVMPTFHQQQPDKYLYQTLLPEMPVITFCFWFTGDQERDLLQNPYIISMMSRPVLCKLFVLKLVICIVSYVLDYAVQPVFFLQTILL